MYSQQLLDHFRNPRNAGDLPSPDVSAQVENPVCGDVLRLSLRIEDGRIAQIGFRAKGCVPAMACASVLTELVKRRTLVEARGLKREEIVSAVGGLPKESMHASHLALDALAAVLKLAPVK